MPYELHPGIPAEGVPREQVLPTAYRAQAEAGLARMAAQVGVTLSAHSRLINSRPALQAAEFARERGRFDAMHRELFSAYWQSGQDISNLSVLRELAVRAGVDAEAMQTAILEDRFGTRLDTCRAEALELMITGIPAHVIAERYLVMGAQPYVVFQQVMTRLDANPRGLAKRS